MAYDKAAQMAANARYREMRGIKQITIQVSPDDRAALDAYAAARSTPSLHTATALKSLLPCAEMIS